MNIWIKQGVMGDLVPVVQKGLGRVADLYQDLGEDLYVTSIREANHWGGSLHYIGFAFDIRAGICTKKDIKLALGPGWDVVYYPTTHIYHCEYDPKEGVGYE